MDLEDMQFKAEELNQFTNQHQIPESAKGEIRINKKWDIKVCENHRNVIGSWMQVIRLSLIWIYLRNML